MKKIISILLILFASANRPKEVNFMLFQILTLEFFILKKSFLLKSRRRDLSLSVTVSHSSLPEV